MSIEIYIDLILVIFLAISTKSGRFVRKPIATISIVVFVPTIFNASILS